MTHRRAPGQGRYAHLEREQRWLLTELPRDAASPVRIVDHYVDGTRLRLRRVEADDETVFKLAQKVRARHDDPERVRITNIYLAADEYETLRCLAGAELIKTRWHVDEDGKVAVDVFEGRHAGLILAERSLADDQPLHPLPAYALRDVTNDDRFSGGRLATATDPEVAQLLAEHDLP